jgi:ApeA N-terminal domain 1
LSIFKEFTDEFAMAGEFDMANDQKIYGELKLAGHATTLYLRDKDFFDARQASLDCLHGTLHDLSKVSMIDCIVVEGPGEAHRGGLSYSHSTLFPHFVVHGDHHIFADREEIARIHLFIEDASCLFYDFDAFGTLHNPGELIEQIVSDSAIRLERSIVTGEDPIIAYFTGKQEIFAVDTVIGRISARHNPSYSISGPNGVSIKNSISIVISPIKPITFDDAISHSITLTRYLGLLIGRAQKLNKCFIEINRENHRPAHLTVYWCMPIDIDRATTWRHREPSPGDVLIAPLVPKENFESVMKNWLQLDHEREDSRGRFLSLFSLANKYSVDRLIGAANMFDLLPASAAPSDTELNTKLDDAKKECQSIFRALESSYERDSVLSALGRLGKSSLKHKIRHRAQIVSNIVGERFPDLKLVLEAAVDCRNHYVHGSKSKVDYEQNTHLLSFFTDTLEFVFAASDLIDAGWDLGSWLERGTTMSHPFGAFRVNYSQCLTQFHSVFTADLDNDASA